MTAPVQSSFPVTIQRAWARLMVNMGGTNMQRARDARKAAQELTRMRTRR